MLEKNKEYIVKIEEMGCNGEGIARIEGCAVFLPYAIIGETVKAKILKVKSNYAFGKVIDVIEESKYRTTPNCPVFYKCGGCNLQHIQYERQLFWKSSYVSDCFHKIAGIDVSVPATIFSEKIYRYRNKLQLPVRSTDKGNLIGFFRENSHDIIPTDDCCIQSGWVKDIISAFKNFINKTNVSCFNEITNKGVLKHIVAREVCGRMIIVAVITCDMLKKCDLLIDELKKYFDNFSLFININKLNNNVVFGDTFKLIYGEEKISICENNITISMGPESFMQVNDDVRKKIYAKVCELIGECGAVIDAYSGAGFLTAQLAQNATFAYGIECVKEAVDCANKLIEDNNIKNVVNICGKCEDVVPDLISNVKNKFGSVSVVLDPPRKGCDLAVLNAVCNAKPDKIIYISCNPSTLARDVGILTGKLCYEGSQLIKSNENREYTITYVQPYDMFPQTKHVESVVLLCRNIDIN